MTLWRKSSYSTANGQCLEVACLNTHPWRKSSRSPNNGGNCIEAASTTPDTIAIRDSKNARGHDYPVLTVSTADWAGFLTTVTAPTLGDPA